MREYVLKPGFSGGGAHAHDFRRPALGGLPKRAFDIAIAGIALVLLSPIILAIVVLTHWLMGKPVIFSQQRIGLAGRTFACYKFRTTLADAKWISLDQRAADQLRKARDPNNDFWAEGLGEILRRASLDKLPQFFNVLRGDMSLVGPRPIAVHELPRYRARAPEYFTARPGLTGMCRETSTRNCYSNSAHIALDRYYVRRWSMRLDLTLLIKTISATHHAKETA